MAPESLALCKSTNCWPVVGCWPSFFVVPPPSWKARHPESKVVIERPTRRGKNRFFTGISMFDQFSYHLSTLPDFRAPCSQPLRGSQPELALKHQIAKSGRFQIH